MIDDEAQVAVEVVVTRHDIAALMRSFEGDAPARMRFVGGSWMFLKGLSGVSAVVFTIVTPWAWVLVALEGAVLTLEFVGRRQQQSLYPVAAFNGQYLASPEGMVRTNSFSQTTVAWPSIVARSTGDRYLILCGGSGWVIPFRCFNSDEHREHFHGVLMHVAAKDSPNPNASSPST